MALSGVRLATNIKTVLTPLGFTYSVDALNTVFIDNVSEQICEEVENYFTAGAPLPSLLDGSIWVGNSLDVPTAHAVSGDITLTNTGVSAVGANKIVNTMIRKSAAYGILGNATNALADVADIIAGSDGDVLRRSGTTLGFGSIEQSSVTNLVSDLAGKISSTLTSAYFYVGNGSNVATAVTMTGDVSMTNAGVTAIGAGKVTLNMQANIATASILGRNTAGTGIIEVLSSSTVKTLLSLNLVENTALSTWGGSSTIVTIGTLTSGLVGIAYGGTGQTTKAAGFDALSPLNTLGDILYGGASGTGTRLPGNTVAAIKFLSQTGVTSASAAPVWTSSSGSGSVMMTASPTTTGVFTADAANFSSTVTFGTYTGQTSIVTLGTVVTGVWHGTSISTLYTDAQIKTVTGTTNRLSIGGTATDPTFDISTSYVGQATITTLGTITAGVWNGTTLPVLYGGTGVTTSTGSGDNVLSVSPTFTGTAVFSAATFSGTLVVTGTSTLTGNVAIGGSPSTARAIWLRTTTLTGTDQTGFYSSPTFGTAATGSAISIFANVTTAAGSYVVADVEGIRIENAAYGAGSSGTVQYGLRILSQTGGATCYSLATGLGLVAFGDAVTCLSTFAVSGASAFSATSTATITANSSSVAFKGINASNGAAATMSMNVQNDLGNQAILQMYGSGFTTSTYNVADGALVYSNGAGGTHYQAVLHKFWNTTTFAGTVNAATNINLTHATNAEIRESGGGYLVVSTTSNHIFVDPADSLYVRPGGGYIGAIFVNVGAADRYFTFSGSIGGNPTISTNSGAVAITTAVILSSSLDITGNTTLGTVGLTAMGDGGSPKILQVNGASGYGLLSLTTSNTADGSTTGVINFGSTGASTTKRNALIASTLRGSGTTHAGGDLQFYTQTGGVFTNGFCLFPSGNAAFSSGAYTDAGYKCDILGTARINALLTAADANFSSAVSIGGTATLAAANMSGLLSVAIAGNSAVALGNFLNSSAGGSASGNIKVGETTSDYMAFQYMNSGFTPASTLLASMGLIYLPSTVTGGLLIRSDATAAIRFAPHNVVSFAIAENAVTVTGTLDSSGTITSGTNIKLTTAGGGIYIKEGTNACMGAVTLVLGVATVNTTKVTANSRIFLTVQSLGTVATPIAVDVTGRTAGTSFTITSANLTDTSVVAWEIKEPA